MVLKWCMLKIMYDIIMCQHPLITNYVHLILFHEIYKMQKIII